MTRVIVHIERLVLRGIAAGERHALAGGLREELTRLLVAPEVVPRLVAVGHLARLRVRDAGEPGGAAHTGAAVARGIDRALGAPHRDTAR